MNAIHQARQAYAPGQIHLRSARSAELSIFGRITARLKDACAAKTVTPELAEAVYDNRRLWTRLAADVADPANALPPDLRARLFYLAEFTEHHSRRVLRGEADLLALIEVNTAIMRGLGEDAGAISGAGR